MHEVHERVALGRRRASPSSRRARGSARCGRRRGPRPGPCVATRAARRSAPGLRFGRAVLRELVQRVRPVVPVDEVEVRVARVVGDRAPVLRVLHAVDDRAVAARRLAEAAAMLARGERAELAVDERDDLARQVVGVAADRRRVDVLVAAERREAVGEHDDRRPHLLLVDEPRGALGHVLAEAASSSVCARPEPVKPTRS